MNSNVSSLSIAFLLTAGTLGCAAVHSVADAPAAGTREVRLLKRIPMPGTGYFDLIAFDSANRRLFLSRTDRVQVVNVDDNSMAGEISGLSDVHSVALAADLDRAFISVAGDNSVHIVRLRSLQPIQSIHIAGSYPDVVFYDRPLQRVLSFNGRSQDATVIDARTGAIVGTIAVHGYGESAVADEAGLIYVTVKDRDQVAVLDPQRLTVVGSLPVPHCVQPHGLTRDALRHRLLVGCVDRLVVMDEHTGTLIREVETGGIADQNAYDVITGLLFQPGGDHSDTLAVVHVSDDAYTVIARIAVPVNSQMAALDPSVHHVFIPSYDTDSALPMSATAGTDTPANAHVSILVFGGR